jgi:uncharacterized protein (UPF0332 family)
VTSPFLQKAETSLKSAKMPLDAGDTDSACSRSYYAMYDAARACLAWASIEPVRGEFKTHHGLITAFSLHLVKPGIFPADIGKALQNVQTLRLAADYEAAPVPAEKAEQALAAAANFVATASALVATSYQGPSVSTP